MNYFEKWKIITREKPITKSFEQVDCDFCFPGCGIIVEMQYIDREKEEQIALACDVEYDKVSKGCECKS